MSETATQSTAFDFGKLVPGFDFLQNLTQAAAKNSGPSAGVGAWVAPTLNVEDIQKRIEELKAVQFWLEQNSRALSATIQALEVQKMTLSTLSAMNVSMGDLASAFQVKPTPAKNEPAPDLPTGPQTEAQTIAKIVSGTEKEAAPASATATAEKGAVDPLAWWGAVTQQFQQIAAQVLKEVPIQKVDLGKASAAAKTPKPSSKASPKSPSKPGVKRSTPAAAKKTGKPKPPL